MSSSSWGDSPRRASTLPRKCPSPSSWTDRIGEPDFLDGFVAFHEQHLVDWSPDDWSLNLLVHENGELAGT